MRPAMRGLPRHLSRRAFTLSAPSLRPLFRSSPAPPRLPNEEQKIFERLQRQSTGAFSTPRSEPAVADHPSRPQINQSPHSEPSASIIASGDSNRMEVRFENGKDIKKGEDLHPQLRRGAPPEFEGDVNPKTGEVGGPKNEPLRWGETSDWSYNGRVTDF